MTTLVYFKRDFVWTPYEGSNITFLCREGDQYEVEDECAELAIERDCAIEIFEDDDADLTDGETDGE